MARGNGRQDIVRDDADRDRLQQELGRAAVRCGWKVYAFVILSGYIGGWATYGPPTTGRPHGRPFTAYSGI
jgi:hypothetical protein